MADNIRYARPEMSDQEIEALARIEEGSHAALIARGGHYAELYDTYFRHQSPDYCPPPVAKPEPALADRR